MNVRAYRGWSKWFGVLGSRKQQSRRGHRRPRLALPRLEALEDRKLMAVLNVAAVVATESQDVVFQVTRTGDLSSTATVEYRTLEGTALEGSDYVAVGNELTFAPGESLQTVQVPLTSDAV